MNTADRVHRMTDYIRAEVEKCPRKEWVEITAKTGQSKAGKNAEEVFTLEVFCPILANFFYKEIRGELSLDDSAIQKCLGAQGYKHLPQFGFTPADTKPHLFTKDQVVQDEPPQGWRKAGKLAECWACPDFAIESPLLPHSTVGEVKYLRSSSPEKALNELFNAARQAVFYLGSFRGLYRAAIIAIADASGEPKSFLDGPDSILNPSLLERFGEQTGIYLLWMKLS